MSGIVWLASYPKSGNTWFRIFLANLMAKHGRPVEINEVFIPNFSDRLKWDEPLGWASIDFDEGTVFAARFDVQNAIARTEPRPIFKTHDAFLVPGTNIPIVSAAATRCAIYIVRNPLDVALSYANHSNVSLDATIERMNARGMQLSDDPTDMRPQMRQFLGDWSWHTSSWADAAGIKVHVMRYEDMLDRPEETFSRACAFMGLRAKPERIARALEASAFSKLREQEQKAGFREKPRNCPQFFNEGKAGRWREGLQEHQVEAIVKAHGPAMKRFGYGA